MTEPKQKVLLCGMPRSGTTLLTSILNQNPEVFATPNSALCQVLWDTQIKLFNNEQFNAYPNYQGSLDILNSLADNYYSHRSESVIIDKCRDWGVPPNQQIAKLYIDENPKYIIVVRDVLEVLSSFISLINKPNQITTYFDAEILYSYRSLDDARCDFLMKPNGLIDRCLWSISSLLDPKTNADYCLITYDEIINTPEEVTNRVYDFIGIDRYIHDFDNIVNKYPEDDKIFGFNGFHSIRPKVEKISIPYKEVLSEYVVNKYKNYNVW